MDGIDKGLNFQYTLIKLVNNFSYVYLKVRDEPMVIQSLSRINELARKEKQSGLTAEEKAEQQRLRKSYLGDIRGSMEKIVTNTTVLDPLGNDVTPIKVKALQDRYHIS